MKKVLILQMRPEDETADSEFRAFLREGHIPETAVERIRVEASENIEIDLNNYSAIIAGGSPFDVSLDKNKKGQAQQRVEIFFKKLFDQVVEEDFPFLGACSGNGLLGSYCGANISGKYSEDIGGTLVELTEEGKQDALLEGLPNNFLAMVGHKEACDDIPPGAVLLASSKACPIQMFRVKKNIYATQFHPEADAGEFIIRIRTYRHSGYFSPDRAEELIEAMKELDTPEPKKILKKFIERYCDFNA